MIREILLFIITLAFLIIVDSVWISKVMGGFYTEQLRPIALMKGSSLSPRIVYALLTWVLVALGLFAVRLVRVLLLDTPVSSDDNHRPLQSRR